MTNIKERLIANIRLKHSNDWRMNEFIEFINNNDLTKITLPCRFQHFENDIKQILVSL